jgi:hypothetical protein
MPISFHAAVMHREFRIIFSIKELPKTHTIYKHMTAYYHRLIRRVGIVEKNAFPVHEILGSTPNRTADVIWLTFCAYDAAIIGSNPVPSTILLRAFSAISEHIFYLFAPRAH